MSSGDSSADGVWWSWLRGDIVPESLMLVLLADDEDKYLNELSRQLTPDSAEILMLAGSQSEGAAEARNVVRSRDDTEFERDTNLRRGVITDPGALEVIPGEIEHVRVVRGSPGVTNIIWDHQGEEEESRYLNGRRLKQWEAKQITSILHDPDLLDHIDIESGCALTVETTRWKEILESARNWSIGWMREARAEVAGRLSGQFDALVEMCAVMSAMLDSLDVSPECANLQADEMSTDLTNILEEYYVLHNDTCKALMYIIDELLDKVRSITLLPTGQGLPEVITGANMVRKTCEGCEYSSSDEIRAVIADILTQHSQGAEAQSTARLRRMRQTMNILLLGADMGTAYMEAAGADIPDLFVTTGTMSFDFVPCLECTFWPAPCREWLERCRMNLPAPGSYDIIMRGGCELVAKPRKIRHSPDDTVSVDYDWRISMAKTETILARLQSVSQRKAYYTFKMMFYKHFKATPGAESLPSYCGKTIMLYMCEKKPESWWNEHSTAIIVLEMFKEVQKCVEERRLEHYFLSGVNLFDNWGLSDDVMQSVLRKVRKAIAEPQKWLVMSDSDVDTMYACIENGNSFRTTEKVNPFDLNDVEMKLSEMLSSYTCLLDKLNDPASCADISPEKLREQWFSFIHWTMRGGVHKEVRYQVQVQGRGAVTGERLEVLRALVNVSRLICDPRGVMGQSVQLLVKGSTGNQSYHGYPVIEDPQVNQDNENNQNNQGDQGNQRLIEHLRAGIETLTEALQYISPHTQRTQERNV